MSRLLVIIVIAVVLYLLIKSYRKKPPSEPTAAEDMVRCSHCGMHLPKSESIKANEQYFCCAEHREAHFR